VTAHRGREQTSGRLDLRRATPTPRFPGRMGSGEAHPNPLAWRSDLA
jgi:hypothetical protein